MSANRRFIPIQLDVEVKDRIDKIREQHGMTQTVFASRLVNWFVRQDDYIIALVLKSLSDPSMAALAKSRLEMQERSSKIHRK